MAQEFFPDDPLWKEPPSKPVVGASFRALNELWDFASNQFGTPGELQPPKGVIPAQGINTLGEVLDGPWFINRHGRSRMTAEELQRGPGTSHPPAMDQPWQVLTVKPFGIRPGIFISDSRKQLYVLRFDPPGQPELATGVTMVAANLMYALGYWVPENYIVYFHPDQLRIAPEGEVFTSAGTPRKLEQDDLILFFNRVASPGKQGYRAVATKLPEGKGLGPFEFFGTRSDDPNDIVFHEHRRELRALSVFAAWLNNHMLSPLLTYDFLVQENGVPSIRHYHADFYTTLGGAHNRSKEPRMGYEPLYDFHSAVKNFFGMGIYTPAWQRASSPKVRGIGYFEAKAFDPVSWVPNYPTAPLRNRLPDDLYWGAKQVMAFTDEDIRILVKAGQYSQPAAEEWLSRCLQERRDKIGRAFLPRVLPLDNFRIEEGTLKFDDLEVRYGFKSSRALTASWRAFDNHSKATTPILDSASWQVPPHLSMAPRGSYFVVRIEGEEKGMALRVYLRKEAEELKLVGIQRDWPGKILAESAQPRKRGKSRYVELNPRQKALFDDYTHQYNQKTGLHVGPEDYFESLGISERTTFDAVTHAALNSKLTATDGTSLGVVFDLIKSLERIAGQYNGRQGDEQFRLYFLLQPNAREIVEKSVELRREKDNTVYHVGYPFSFRQKGKPPTMQISMSEDSNRADFDVDYLSSKMPKAMWNGHLTSANSDVRARDNYQLHNRRWSGLVAWWSEIFGNLKEETPGEEDLLAPGVFAGGTPIPADRPMGTAIPEIQDAVVEFLADWLVRKNIVEAQAFVSDRALECVRQNAGQEGKTLSVEEARHELHSILKDAAQRLGTHQTLGPFIQAVVSWRKGFQTVNHPYSNDFTLLEVPDVFADAFLCENLSREAVTKSLQDPNAQYGHYFGILFKVRTGDDQGAVVELLWAKENGAWRIIAFQPIRP
jgi:hypothetical protein